MDQKDIKDIEEQEYFEININSDNPEVAEYICNLLKQTKSLLIEGVIFGSISNTEFKGENVDIYCNIINEKPSIKIQISNIQGYHYWRMDPVTGKCTLKR